MSSSSVVGHQMTAAERELRYIIKAQSFARKWIARHHYLRTRRWLIRLQAIVRAWIVGHRLLQSARKHARRTRIFFEILAVEKSYVSDLDNIINQFKYPLLNKHIITPQDAVNIFANIEAIYDIHMSLLDSLRTLKKVWNYKTGVGACFLNEIFKMDAAYKQYIPFFDDYTDTLKTRRMGEPALDKFLKGVEGTKKLRNLDLQDLLIQPVQRIPRYAMLLKEYLKFTPEDHPDFELVNRLAADFTRILNEINMMKRRSLNETKSRFLLTEMSGANLTGLTEYEMEGELTRRYTVNQFNRKCYVFLFDEMFIIAKQSSPDTDSVSAFKTQMMKVLQGRMYKFRLRKVIKMRSIAEITSHDADNETKVFAMKVLKRDKKDLDVDTELRAKRHKTYYFQAPSEKLKMTWVDIINKLVARMRQQRSNSLW